MITIPIQVSGDAWNNREQVEQQLDTLEPHTSIMLDLCSEGPSLHHLGVVDLLAQYDFNVSVTRWSNGVETVPFRRHFCNSQSHFYPMSRHYWTEEIINEPTAEFQFGLFVGRSTPDRDRILYDAVHSFPGKFLLSKMPNKYNTSISWVDSIPSLQGYTIQDQYKIPELSTGQMMLSLIQEHYSRFNIELVCETYTRGDTFFPTEKTVRAIVGNKPFIVYGPCGFLNNLKKYEGFQTFGNLWDESYDQLEGQQRWQAMFKLIDSLLSLDSKQWADLVRQSSVITQHNRNILKKIINDRKKL